MTTLSDLGQGPELYQNVVFSRSSTRVNGTNGRDFLVGTRSSDRINGFRGVDAIDGNAGNDTIFAGPGDDYVVGNAGSDILVGGLDDDIVAGGSGNDFITGLGEFENLSRLNYFRDAFPIDRLIGGKGADRFDTVFDGNDYSQGPGYAIIEDFNPNEGDRIGVSNRLDADDILVRDNGVSTEIIDKSGLDLGVVSAILNAAGNPLGSILPDNLRLKVTIADIFARDFNEGLASLANANLSNVVEFTSGV
jgi:serralysin